VIAGNAEHLVSRKLQPFEELACLAKLLGSSARAAEMACSRSSGAWPVSIKAFATAR